jgi:hypothetical protein
MSRTKRSKDLNNKNLWNWKSKPVGYIREGRPELYWVDKMYIPNYEQALFPYPAKEDLYEELYKVRARHSSTSYPYYLQWKVVDSYDERCHYPAAYFDRYSYQ